ncbi:MAG: sensor histidine kinase [Nitrospirae bacterium]|nr:sensor histidine kinase [Nitrospirota bacterium]
MFEKVKKSGDLGVVVEREGRSYRAVLHPSQPGGGHRFGSSYNIRLLIVLAFFLTGLLVYLRGASELTRKVFMEFAGAGALMALTWWPAYSENAIPETRLFAAIFATGNFAAGLTIVELIRFLSIFPSPRIPLRRLPVLTWALRAYIILATAVLFRWDSPLLFWALWTVGLPLVVILLFDTYLRAPLAVNRTRMEWIFIGLAASLTLAVFLHVPRVVLREASLLDEEWNLLVLLPIPIAMGLAVESWRIVRVNRLLESSIAIITGLLVLAVIYGALFLILSHTHVPVGLYRRSVMMSGLAASGIVVSLLYLQREKLLIVARRLLRGEESPRPQAVEMEQTRLFDATEPDAVVVQLRGALDRLFQPAWLVAWIRRPSGAPRRYGFGDEDGRAEAEATLSKHHLTLEARLKIQRRAMLLAEVHDLDGVSPSLLDAAFAPMLDRNGQVLGVVGIGPRVDCRLYDRESLDSLTRLVGKAGLLIELLIERSEYDAAIEGEQRSRERLGREIHDTVGSELTNIILLAQSFKNTGAGVPSRVPNVEQLFGLIEKRARSGLEEVRTVSWSLRSQETDQDFLDWLKRYAADSLTPLGIELEFKNPPDAAGTRDSSALRPELRLHLSRIFQEALSNVIRHAAAKRVIVHWSREDGRLRLAIQDDGVGFDPERLNGSLSTGLENMLHRARTVGGVLQIASEPRTGTRVEVVVGRA